MVGWYNRLVCPAYGIDQIANCESQLKMPTKIEMFDKNNY